MPITPDPWGLGRFEVAVLGKHVAFPLDPWFLLGDPRLVLALAFLGVGLALDVRRLSLAVRTGPA